MAAATEELSVEEVSEVENEYQRVDQDQYQDQYQNQSDTERGPCLGERGRRQGGGGRRRHRGRDFP